MSKRRSYSRTAGLETRQRLRRPQARALEEAVGPKSTEEAEALIQSVLNEISNEELQALVPEQDDQWIRIRDGLMAWFAYFRAARRLSARRRAQTIAQAWVILGAYLLRVYALGVRRGKAASSEETSDQEAKETGN